MKIPENLLSEFIDFLKASYGCKVSQKEGWGGEVARCMIDGVFCQLRKNRTAPSIEIIAEKFLREDIEHSWNAYLYVKAEEENGKA